MNTLLNQGAIVPACLIVSCLPLPAATWNGGGKDDDWRTRDNWADRTRPVEGEALVFAGATSLQTNNDFKVGSSFGGIAFASGSGAFTLGGNRIELTGDVTNRGERLQTIDLAMELGGARTFDSQAGSLAIGGALSGTGGLVKTGAAHLTLSGNNSYTGPTSVTAGTLWVNGDQSAAKGNLTVNSGAFLGGVGTVGGATTIAGTHVPGAASNVAGTQTFGAGLSYTATSLFSWTLASESTTTGFDRIVGNGALQVHDDAVFRIVLGTALGVLDSSFWNSNRTWSTIFTGFTGGNFSNSRLLVVDSGASPYNTGAQGQFSIRGTTLTWSAVPEPSAAAIGLLLGAGALRRRRARTRDKS